MKSNTPIKNESEFDFVNQFFDTQVNFICPKSLLRKLKSIEKTVFLTKLFCLSLQKKDGWLYKTYADWREDILLSERQIRRFAREFKSQGFLMTKVKQVNGVPCCWYKIDSDKFFHFVDND